MSFWFRAKEKDGHRSFISVGLPIPLITFILLLIFLLVRC